MVPSSRISKPSCIFSPGTFLAGALLLLASTGCVSAAVMSVNELRSGYDKAAPDQYSLNGVKSFIYQRFAGFDHQREAARGYHEDPTLETGLVKLDHKME